MSDINLTLSALESSKPEVFAPQHSIQSALALLATLHKRMGGMVDRIASQCDVLATGSHVRTLVTELPFLEAHSDEPLETLLSRLVKLRVLDRHLWVAVQKFRSSAGDYTFLFEPDNGRVRFRAKDGPILTNPRLSSAIAFLEDLQLLGATGPTAAGLRILESAA